MPDIDYSKLKIEKGTVPASRRERKGLSGLLVKLQVGESVFVPKYKTHAASSIAQYAIGVGKYRIRSEANGVRIWRTA